MLLEGRVTDLSGPATDEVHRLAVVAQATCPTSRLELDPVHCAEEGAGAGPGDRLGTATLLDDVERLAAAQNRHVRRRNGLGALRHESDPNALCAGRTLWVGRDGQIGVTRAGHGLSRL